MKYHYPFSVARTINKYGVDITIFDENVDINTMLACSKHGLYRQDGTIGLI